MENETPVLMDEHQQQPIPTVWRQTFSEIVEAFKNGDFQLHLPVTGVRSISYEDAQRMAKNIESYGASLASLPDDTWRTSICQWMRGYWQVLIDLYTVEEGSSDLVLFVRVYEMAHGFDFEVESIDVP